MVEASDSPAVCEKCEKSSVKLHTRGRTDFSILRSTDGEFLPSPQTIKHGALAYVSVGREARAQRAFISGIILIWGYLPGSKEEAGKKEDIRANSVS